MSHPASRSLAPPRALYELSTIELARIQKLFAEIDADDDGEISALELESVSPLVRVVRMS